MQAQPIERTEAHLSDLRLLVHPPNLLQRRGFVLGQLNKTELEKKRRCGRCNKALSKREYEEAQAKPENDAATEAGDKSAEEGGVPLPSPLAALDTDQHLTAILQTTPRPEPREQGQGKGRRNRKGKKEEMMRCLAHPGRVQGGRWTCCQNSLMSKPCTKSPSHSPRIYADQELENHWRFYGTPYNRDDTHPRFAAAVSIDCEMGTNDYGESELIRVSVVDYFSGAVLLDKLVFPDVKILHWNTRFSGVSARDMHEARTHRTCLFGRANARRAIWKFVSPETIVIGHAVHGDLASLRWIHPRVVDTLIIEEEIVRREKARREREEQERQQQEALEEGEDGEIKEEAEGVKQAVKVPPQPLGLKALAKERLDRTIQVKGRGHDSVEDALATRDLLHWHIVNRLKVDW